MPTHEYLSVTTLSAYLQRKFDQDPYLGRVYLTGELSNFRLRPGHQYFSLKDDHAKISAVMFKSAFSKLKFTPESGMKVLVVGRVTMYAASGQYQIVIEHMEPDGVGAFYQAYEQLKAKLEKAGAFAQNQRPLRQFPTKVAVITSPSGAVIQDIRTTVARRYPGLQLTLYPAVVQGDGSAKDLVRQLHRVAENGDYDAVIIGRGGGSIEDLWPFNDETVAQAVLEMPMPVVSSVGHETDTTIVDFVADHRAATPTAAAELVTPVTLVDALNGIAQYRSRITAAMQNRLTALQERLARSQKSVVLTQPNRLYDQYVQQVDQLRTRLNQVMQSQLDVLAHRVSLCRTALAPRNLQLRLNTQAQVVQQLRQRLNQATAVELTNKRQAMQSAVAGLDHLSPLKILGRGYTYVTDENGKMLKATADYQVDSAVTIHTQDGEVTARVLNAKENNANG
ncbi:exodeoxyribonuclease VII large subunit [Lacticaseibacillus manihotivorans]|jgi:exodeoxyribonuclease VII large subunit|uniref:Exodeoxyribonuclease 7 large subunit n=2 Tax=Lacticaseibacillus manihotivorans TaxID=88233 RepID=A0A0R1R926_9LACO|nr:exodeoxyribonuclease VII large subunit [Lacticaseibacillus manihotivorans]KRL53209.1 exodeoxyribonuclease VII large subunit [Lacticaseibacillus manihotivorans DSM 13343 = JCM 12514]QFQ91200.1 exodeoxyribonuclease VII large subunit [Lacticaseibacillus manihotivorans]